MAGGAVERYAERRLARELRRAQPQASGCSERRRYYGATGLGNADIVTTEGHAETEGRATSEGHAGDVPRGHVEGHATSEDRHATTEGRATNEGHAGDVPRGHAEGQSTSDNAKIVKWPGHATSQTRS